MVERLETKTFMCEAPSNIALLKYWGKEDGKLQWPCNDSISISLSFSYTRTLATELNKGQDKEGQAKDHIFFFGNQEMFRHDSFAAKTFKHLDFLQKELNKQTFLKIISENTFPQGCGIASSASSMAALTVASIAAWTHSSNLTNLEKLGFTRNKLSDLARIASGSACRSLWQGFVLWEKNASPVTQKAYPLNSPWLLAHTIVLLTEEEKKIPSTMGHLTVRTSPLFAPRLEGLEFKKIEILKAIESQNLKSLGLLIEEEALSMHGVMMSSTPPNFYFNHLTGNFLAWVRQIRKNENLEVYFTLDAGPNAHLICQEVDRTKLEFFLKRDYPHLKYIKDAWGKRDLRLEEL